MKKNYNFKIILSLLTWFVLLPTGSWASLRLNVAPVEGLNTLNFGKVDVMPYSSKEVRVRISSSDGKPYQVFQRIQQPFINQHGETIDRSVIAVGSLSGSNSFGTLYLQGAEPLSFNDQHVYTSDSNGADDSFTLIYRIDANMVNASGIFEGQILYSVRPVGGASEDTVVLNARLEKGEGLKVEMSASQGTNQVRMVLDETSTQPAAYVKFAFTENTLPFKIYQEVMEFPKDETAQEMSSDLVNFSVLEAREGDSDYLNPTPLERKRVLIYESEARQDEVVIAFNFDPADPQNKKAANYIGRISYLVEVGETQKTFDVDLYIDIPKVFKMDVILPSEGVAFNRLLPMSPPQTKEVSVKVKTNLQKPYLVYQNIDTPLENAKGQEMLAENFQMQVIELNENPGDVLFLDFHPVTMGDVPVFRSDKKGSPSEFKVIYRVKPYDNMLPGDYHTTVRYSLGEN